MTDRLSENWVGIAVRGVVAIVFGILAFAWPGLTLLALVLLFGAYAFVDGVSSIVTGARGGDGRGRDWLMILGGIAGVAAGVIAVGWPGISSLALLMVIAAWAVVTGAFEVAAAYRLRHEIRGAWLLLLDGIVSILFGALLVISPGTGALAVVWLIGAYAIVSGVLLLVLAVRLRDRVRTRAGSGSTASAA
jgi:uncharacterized membrane protein HdeD (DUF308 family)